MLAHVLLCSVCVEGIASVGAVELLLPSDSEPIIDVFMENCSSSWTSKLPVETPVTRLQTVMVVMVESHPVPVVVIP